MAEPCPLGAGHDPVDRRLSPRKPRSDLVPPLNPDAKRLVRRARSRRVDLDDDITARTKELFNAREQCGDVAPDPDVAVEQKDGRPLSLSGHGIEGVDEISIAAARE